MKTLYENENVVIRLEETHKYIEHEWKTFCPTEQFKASLEKTHQLTVQNGCRKLLFSMERGGSYAPEINQWVQTHWFPKMNKAGVTKYALVLGQSAIKKMAVNATKKQVQSQSTQYSVDTQYFGTIDEGRAFIKQ